MKKFAYVIGVSLIAALVTRLSLAKQHEADEWEDWSREARALIEEAMQNAANACENC